MTHKARILRMLTEAGDKGVSSKLLYREFMGRGAARIKELRDEGYQIDSSEKDPGDPKFCIYKLAGVGADVPGPGQVAVRGVSVDSSETLFELAPSAYEQLRDVA